MKRTQIATSSSCKIYVRKMCEEDVSIGIMAIWEQLVFRGKTAKR